MDLFYSSTPSKNEEASATPSDVQMLLISEGHPVISQVSFISVFVRCLVEVHDDSCVEVDDAK